ncbi:MAG TPA: thymidine phosphorylase [Balneolales bacterium]|nr:thymidine phosphorylase [Balneolales bacterium]
MKEYNTVSLIRKKRDGLQLGDDEISWLIKSYTAGKIPDYQMSAMLMAMFLNGLDKKESASLTEQMLHSGTVLDLSDIPGRKVDKHSTGGVGDKVSLILAPIVASQGVPVPMISGRGLGHTGGTLDKLESITGYNVNLSLDEYRAILQKNKMVMSGQTKDVAPADKLLYALRDVTGTVESIPLIAGSIMSKKLAEGIDGLVLDIKVGDGAFMKTGDEAIKLGRTLVDIGEEFGKTTVGYITDMSQPLGCNVGNWLEVVECIDALSGKGPEDLMQVTHVLAGTMLRLGGKVDSVEEGVKLSEEAIDNGSAYDKFVENVKEQGGDIQLIEHPDRYPSASWNFEVKVKRSGFLSGIKAYQVGIASLELGAGRRAKEDDIDPVAGIILHHKTGDRIEKNETLFTCFTNNKAVEREVHSILEDAVSIEDSRRTPAPLISHRIDRNGILEWNA